MHGKSLATIIMPHQQIGVPTIMHKFSNLITNLEKTWTDKLNNGIIMCSKKITEVGDLYLSYVFIWFNINFFWFDWYVDVYDMFN